MSNGNTGGLPPEGGAPSEITGALAWVWIRRIVAVGIASLAGWVANRFGLTVDLETQAAFSGLVLLGIWFAYSRARKAGWFGLVALLALAPMAGLVGCASGQGPGSPQLSQRQEYQVAWFFYTVLRSAARSYCGLPGNGETPACIEAASAIVVADAVIDATKQALDQGTVSPEVAFSQGRQRLEQVVPKLEAVQPPTGGGS